MRRIVDIFSSLLAVIILLPVFAVVAIAIRLSSKGPAIFKQERAGIELGSWFECPLHPIETPLAAYDYETGMCPEAEKASNEAVNLPLHPRANEATAKKSVEFITEFTPVE